MSPFLYTAVNNSGKRVSGELDAHSKEEAGRMIRRMGLTKIISISSIVKKKKKKFNLSEINITPPTVPPEMKLIFFTQLATLMGAGIQLVDSLTILKVQFKKNKLFTKTLDDITEQVKSGRSFSASLSLFPNVFQKQVVSLVKAAEAGGGLTEMLGQIAKYIEREENIRQKLKSATSYPKFVGIFFSIVLTGVVFGLLPKFKEIFDGFGAELPLPTQIIMDGADFIRGNLVLEGIFLAVTIGGFKAFKKTPNGRRIIDEKIFSIPIVGPMLQKSVITRITQTINVLLQSGVTLVDALPIAGDTTDNRYVEDIMEDIRIKMQQGRGFAVSIQKYPIIFPTMVSSMVQIGEKSGALPLMMEKIAEYNDQEFQSQVDGISEIIEPLMMGSLGVIILIIVVALYLPIFQMSGAIQ